MAQRPNPYKGGQKPLLKSGKEISVDDISGEYVVVSIVEWYHMDEVEKVIKDRADY